jgi:transcriptional regulator with XRE-family HTH domain
MSKEDISSSVRKRIKQIRLSKNLSQGDVAKALGVHITYVSQIERGVRNPTLKNIERLAKALGVPIEDLLK